MARNMAFGKIQEDKEKTGFFKVLIDEDLSSKSMRLIPHKFKTSVCKDLPLKVILKVAWGRSWTVNLTEFKRYYLMEKEGWEKFLRENNLGDKEFLTFTNEGNNCLSVDIFRKNCCEILEPREATSIASSSSSKRNVYRASSSSSSVAAFSITIKPSYLLALSIPQAFATKYMPKEKTKFFIHDPKGKSWEVLYVHARNTQKFFSRGWRTLARDYGLAVGDLCTFRLVKPKEMVLEVVHASQ